jgi:hypothetical protein
MVSLQIGECLLGTPSASKVGGAFGLQVEILDHEVGELDLQVVELRLVICVGPIYIVSNVLYLWVHVRSEE